MFCSDISRTKPKSKQDNNSETWINQYNHSQGYKGIFTQSIKTFEPRKSHSCLQNTADVIFTVVNNEQWLQIRCLCLRQFISITTWRAYISFRCKWGTKRFWMLINRNWWQRWNSAPVSPDRMTQIRIWLTKNNETCLNNSKQNLVKW